MVRESRARKQDAVQWPPGGGSSAFCIAPRPKWMAETRPSPKVGPRTMSSGSGVARRRRGRPRFTFLRYITRLGVARVFNLRLRRTKAVRFRLIKETKPLGMALVLSKVNMRSVDPILPLKIQNPNAFNGFLAVVGCFRALLSRTTSGVLSCAPRTRRHAGCGSYHRYTPQTAPPRPIWPQI